MAAWGSSGAIRPGNAATNAMTSRISAPTAALGLPRTVGRKGRGAPGTSTPGASSLAAMSTMPVVISSLSGPRVEHRRDQVGEQHADEHRDRVEEEQSLHQRQVVIGGGGVEEITEPRI